MPLNFDFETIPVKNESSLKERITPEILKKKGIVTFAAGEMDFKCPDVINDAVVLMARNGYYGFTLKDDRYDDAIVKWFKRVRNIDVNKEDIVSTLGTIHSLANCIKLFCKEPEEGILVLAPYYSRYKQAADRLKRKTTVSNLCEKGGRYSIDFSDLERKMADSKNRILVLNNPLNPSGTVFTKEELDKISELSNRYHTVVFSDEIFADISLMGSPVPSYYSCKDSQYGIVCTSLGKTFSMTGLNHANVLIRNKELRESFAEQRTNDHYGSMDPLAYVSTIAGYSEEGYLWLNEMIENVKENSAIVHDTINRYFPELKIYQNEASFVCWIDFSAWNLEGEKLHDDLLNKALLDLDTGENYGSDHLCYGRMNLASTKVQITEAMNRLVKGYQR